MRSLVLGWIALALLPLAVWAQEPGVALKDDLIRKEPYSDAKTAGKLKRGDNISILKRSGGWYQIKAGATRGWVRMLSVRRGEAGKTSAASEIGGAASLATGRAGTGQIVSTTGVRGLSEEDLKSAKFDEPQLRKAESFRVSRSDAERFGAKGALKVRTFAYLPDPRAQAQGTTSTKGR